MSNPIQNFSLDGSFPTGHHVHSENEPLPGAAGAASTVDYSPEKIERVRLPPSEEGATQDLSPHRGAHHHQHAHKQVHGHPADVGVTCGEETPVPVSTQQHDATTNATKPSFGDKVVGKTQELAGKVTHNEALQEKGELRKLGETTTTST